MTSQITDHHRRRDAPLLHEPRARATDSEVGALSQKVVTEIDAFIDQRLRPARSIRNGVYDAMMRKRLLGG